MHLKGTAPLDIYNDTHTDRHKHQPLFVEALDEQKEKEKRRSSIIHRNIKNHRIADYDYGTTLCECINSIYICTRTH